MGTMIYVWRSEDNLLKTIVFYHMGSGNKTHCLIRPQMVISMDKHGLVHQNEKMQKWEANIQ